MRFVELRQPLQRLDQVNPALLLDRRCVRFHAFVAFQQVPFALRMLFLVQEYRAKLGKAGFEEIDVEPTRIYTAESARDFLAGAGLGPEAIAAMDGKFASAFVRARRPSSASRAATSSPSHTPSFAPAPTSSSATGRTCSAGSSGSGDA